MEKAQVTGTQAECSAGNAEASIANAVQLIARIDALHREIRDHEAQALLKARAAGELLLEAKANIKHGEWLLWLSENVTFSQKTAWQYMRIAECWGQLEPNYTHGYNLTIRQALRLVRYGYKGRGV